jgi:hypothetical protein
MIVTFAGSRGVDAGLASVFRSQLQIENSSDAITIAVRDTRGFIAPSR